MGNSDSSFAPLDEEVVAQWLDSLDLSSATKNTYKRAFKSFCAFVKDTSLDFDTLTKRDIISFREYLSVNKRLKPTTVSNYLGAVRSFFSYAEENGIPNIARGVRGERASRDFKKASLSVDQARRLLSSIDRETEAGMRDFALLNLMLRTGLRDIEVVRADCGDIRTVSGVDVLYIQGKGRPGKDNYVVLTESALAPITLECAMIHAATPPFLLRLLEGILARGLRRARCLALLKKRCGKSVSTTLAIQLILCAILPLRFPFLAARVSARLSKWPVMPTSALR